MKTVLKWRSISGRGKTAGLSILRTGKSLNIHGEAVWHGILELTASFAFGNTTIWFPDENVPGN